MSFSSSSTKNIKVFFAYSQQDQRLRQDLDAHLHELRSLKVESKWHKYQVILLLKKL